MNTFCGHYDRLVSGRSVGGVCAKVSPRIHTCLMKGLVGVGGA